MKTFSVLTWNLNSRTNSLVINKQIELTNVENQLNSNQIEDAKSDLNLLINELENQESNLPEIKYEDIQINGC